MEPLYRRYPDDLEAAIFYALALNEAVDHAELWLWQDVIKGDLASEAAAKAYAEKDLPGTILWLHSWDFLTYAYLQGAQDRQAKRILDEWNAIQVENRLVPMHELLGELLLDLNEPAAALREFEASRQRLSNRLRSFYGAAKAAEGAGERPKLVEANAFPARP
jgi:hypothetical protein